MSAGRVVWFTGLSGAGKTTIARRLERELEARGSRVKILDGDVIRKGLCSDLGFSREDRSENTRRVAEVAKLFYESGFTVIVALISPFESDRRKARALFPRDKFTEVFVDCPVEVCSRRDPKGLYKKAAEGQLNHMVGISLEFEPPRDAEVEVRTSELGIEECFEKILKHLNKDSKPAREMRDSMVP